MLGMLLMHQIKLPVSRLNPPQVLSNPSIEADSDTNFSSIYNSSGNGDKDALSEAIMTIPTTYGTTNSSFSDSLGGDDPGLQVTSEMLSKAINVVEGDHNLYFDKVRQSSWGRHGL